MKRARVRHFKEVAAEIVDAAREDSPDPVEAGVKAQQQAKVKSKPISPEEARERRLQVWFNSAWTPHFEAQQAQIEAEKMQQVIALRAGFWCG